ncbi:hypothetical protein F5B22DRAFT_569656 [Xylaria bambusicola]|uniref:uncharacterized protein n=1 Tax=Xylaria bambusicola TaxID=326684 RepID=UPI0020082643|nr:uncharacterized protein F5B22DRAFT_569656 [Xylaria bambusicola]KAI0521331.1 hypothetical protein F5B22DRAFT_569656 [Xylaria bambusicola]
MASNTPESKPFPKGVVDEIPKVSQWLRSPAAMFAGSLRNHDCRNGEGLLRVSRNLMKSLREEISNYPIEHALSAVYFDGKDEIPVREGWVSYLIPIDAPAGTMVGDSLLDPGHYVRMETFTKIYGHFYAMIYESRDLDTEGDMFAPMLADKVSRQPESNAVINGTETGKHTVASIDDNDTLRTSRRES